MKEEILPAVKKKRTWTRRPTSAVAGGAFVTIQDVALRWGVTHYTALKRIREAGIKAYNFSDQCIRYSISDLVRFEESLRA